MHVMQRTVADAKLRGDTPTGHIQVTGGCTTLHNPPYFRVIVSAEREHQTGNNP